MDDDNNKKVGRNGWDALAELFISLRDWKILAIIGTAFLMAMGALTSDALGDLAERIISAWNSR